MTGTTVELVGLVRDLGASGVSECELLKRFVCEHDETAFEALLRRHGPMVWGVCRRTLRDQADAEDAFQATFVVFVRKAAGLDCRGALGNWLFGVARRIACRARADAERRRSRERATATVPRPEPFDAEHEPMLRLLDAEITRLPQRFRAPIVLCDLEGTAIREAAELLRCPAGTVASRLARGRRLLARRMARHGAVLSAATLGAGLVPSHALAAGRAALSDSISPHALSLAEGVLTTMIPTKIKLTLTLVVALGLCFAGSDSFVARAEKPKGDDKPAKSKKEVGPTVHGTVKEVDTAKNKLTVTVSTGRGKESEQKTLDLAKDVKVFLEDAITKVKELPQGKLSDLTEGTSVSAELDVGGKTVVAVRARGPSVNASIKSVDASKKSLTIQTKGANGAVEETITMFEGAKVLLNDGLNKGDPDKEGTLDKLTEGTHVHVQLTVDRKQALSVRPQGKTYHGTLKGIDSGNNSITITVKEDAQVVDKTFTLAKGSRTDGNAAAGVRVNVRLSIFDENTAVHVQVVE
jgi:RNA polymerase sigma factor (sigma-70 family)